MRTACRLSPSRTHSTARVNGSADAPGASSEVLRARVGLIADAARGAVASRGMLRTRVGLGADAVTELMQSTAGGGGIVPRVVEVTCWRATAAIAGQACSTLFKTLIRRWLRPFQGASVVFAVVVRHGFQGVDVAATSLQRREGERRFGEGELFNSCCRVVSWHYCRRECGLSLPCALMRSCVVTSYGRRNCFHSLWSLVRCWT